MLGATPIRKKQGTGPHQLNQNWRDPALQLAYVEWPHLAHCALSHTKPTTVAPIQYVLAGLWASTGTLQT